jgi:hypothetical protein
LPYPNSLQASDLSGGSTSVKVQGAETALEDSSKITTSTGDEGGTQGGNVVTHKTKGKGYFTLWCFDVKVEGKGVDRHGDPIGQNCASSPMGAADIMALVNEAVKEAINPEKPCTTEYDSKAHRHGMVKAQYDAVAAGPCWQCQSTSPLGNDSSGNPIPHQPTDAYTPDHQPPVFLRWYAGGCHMTAAEWKRDFQDEEQVFPHCRKCSNGQGGLSAESLDLAARHAERAGDLSSRAWAATTSTAERFLGGFGR